MRWDFHGLCVQGQTRDDALRERWQASFASRPATSREPDVVCAISLVSAVPDPPATSPDFSQGDLLRCYVQGQQVTAHFPRFGQIDMDLAQGRSEGQLLESALTAPGAFEDLLAVSLSAHFRRRGLFLLHAFAAASPPALLSRGLEASDGRVGGVLLVGGIGAGKTTTGMALLHAGWKLLANDSPLIGLASRLRGTRERQMKTPRSSSAVGEHSLLAFSYPGLMSAYPDSVARFPELAGLLAPAAQGRRQKVLFAAESIWPDVWQDQAGISAIFFPQIERRTEHLLERLAGPETLRMLLPHAIEQWDRAMIPAHLALLTSLAEQAQAFHLRLGPDISTIPAVIASALEGTLL